MKSKESAEKKFHQGKMRLPSEGNILWEMYYKLPRMEQRSLKELLVTSGTAFTTFLRDTEQARPLDLIPFGRLDSYCTFFVGQGFENLFDIARKERPTAKSSAQAALVA